jgi:putative addiction module component (TIGR02574 family)
MNAIDLKEVDALVPAEKLDLLERLWSSLQLTPAQVPVTASHLQVVRERLVEHAAAPDDVVSLTAAVATARKSFT